MAAGKLDRGDSALRLALVEAGRSLDGRGWVMGTSGNLSARVDDATFLITASGRHKGRLTLDDFVAVGRDGETRRPSAEVSIHETIYRRHKEMRAIVHAHSIATTAASLLALEHDGPTDLSLPAIEMIKGFDVWDAEGAVPLLVLPNWRDVSRIAAALETALPALRIPAFLIRGHGGTVWGRSVEEALHRMEVLDFVCEVALRMKR